MAQSIPRPVNVLLIILSVLGLMLWTAGTFIGLYFISGGSYGISIPLAVAIGGLMTLFLFMMRRYTGFMKNGYRARESAKWNGLFLILYILFSVGSVYFVMHAVAVTTTIKDKQRTAALEDLRGLLNLVYVNAPDGSYPKYVNMEVERYRQGNGQKDASTLDFESEQLRQRLLEKSGFNNLQNEITEYWQTADYTVRNWDLIFLPEVTNVLHDRQQIWVDSLQKSSDMGNYDRYASLHTPYNPQFTPSSDLYSQVRGVSGSDFSGWAIPVALLLQVLILGSWIVLLVGGSSSASGIDTSGNDNLIWNSENDWNPDY